MVLLSLFNRPLLSQRALHAYKRAMTSSAAPLLITPSQVVDLLCSGNASVLDASWHMASSHRKAGEEFLSKRIPGANFLDLDEVASPSDLGLKHMMPEARVFADMCENFGISPSTHVVIYDTLGAFSSPRALFMFRAFGHHKSSILDGGLLRWQRAGFPVDKKRPLEKNKKKKSQYPTPEFDENTVRSYQQMVSNSSLDPSVDSSAEIVVDARSRGRYLGTAPEPRPGPSSGHIPHSLSIPFVAFLRTHEVIEEKFTTYRTPDEIIDLLIEVVGENQLEQIMTGERTVVTSCGSGITAGILWLGLKLIGAKNVALYDESWTGYAARKSSRIEKSR